ncbi:hypothetical protein [Paenibacillus medicaginis]
MTGATGVTGPTAPNVTANYQYSSGAAFTTSTPAVFPLIGVTGDGTAITQNGNGTLTLAPNQAYMVDFSVDASIPPASTAGAFVSLNGTNVVGSGVTTFNSTAASQPTFLSSNAIVRTGGTAGTLALNVQGSQATQFGAPAFSVIKIA